MKNVRKSVKERKTGETKIKIEINLDGKGISKIKSPIGMLNHMLDQLAWHGLVDIYADIEGDLETGYTRRYYAKLKSNSKSTPIEIKEKTTITASIIRSLSFFGENYVNLQHLDCKFNKCMDMIHILNYIIFPFKYASISIFLICLSSWAYVGLEVSPLSKSPLSFWWWWINSCEKDLQISFGCLFVIYNAINWFSGS